MSAKLGFNAIALALLVALWHVAARQLASADSLLPAPASVATTLATLLGRASTWKSIGVTAFAVVAAMAIAVPLGIGIGMAVTRGAALARALRPLVSYLFGVPKSIFLPIFILVFSIGIGQKIAFATFTALFVVALGTVAAVESVPPEHLRVARAYGASGWQVLRHIFMPAMAPVLVESVRLATVFSITAVLLAEMYAAQDGLGFRISGWGESQKMPELFAGMTIAIVASILVNESLAWLERRIGAWREG